MKVTRVLAAVGGAALIAAAVAPPAAFAESDLPGAVSEVSDALTGALVPADDAVPTSATSGDSAAGSHDQDSEDSDDSDDSDEESDDDSDERSDDSDEESEEESEQSAPAPATSTQEPAPAPTTHDPAPAPTTPDPAPPVPSTGTSTSSPQIPSPTTPSTPRPATPRPSSTPSTPSVPNSPNSAPDARMSLALSAATTDLTGDKAIGARDRLTFSYVVRNTGEVDLSNISVTSSTGSVSCPATSLAVRASMTCTSAVALSQAQVDAAAVQNAASASATSPTGRAIGAAKAMTAAVAGAGKLGSSLRLAPVSGGSTVARDGSMRATASLVNSGTLTLRSVSVTDGALVARGVTFTCSKTTLAPGVATTCVTPSFKPTTYQKAQKVAKSNATACATTLKGAKVCGAALSASVRVDSRGDGDGPAKPAPAKLSLWQRVVAVNDINEDDELDFKDGLQYAFGVTNSGGLTIRSISVRDGMLSRAGVSVRCPYSVLQPGQSMVCRSSGFYPLTKYQAMEGKITNYAVAVGLRPNGTQVSSNTSVDVHGKAAVVDSVAFGALAVTGSDNVALSSVAVAMLLLGAALLWMRRGDRMQLVLAAARRLRR